MRAQANSEQGNYESALFHCTHFVFVFFVGVIYTRGKNRGKKRRDFALKYMLLKLQASRATCIYCRLSPREGLKVQGEGPTGKQLEFSGKAKDEGGVGSSHSLDGIFFISFCLYLD